MENKKELTNNGVWVVAGVWLFLALVAGVFVTYFEETSLKAQTQDPFAENEKLETRFAKLEARILKLELNPLENWELENEKNITISN
ncbi:MAG: hypothetical protein WC665_05555 [Sulfurimonas sp.]|jgi:hypothetical protein